MGWDAFADTKVVWPQRGEPYLENADHRAAYQMARDEVRKHTPTVDWRLPLGGLDTSDAARMLERATGASAWDENGWTAERVKELAAKANWNFEYHVDLAYAYWSAKLWLETTARLGLKVRFSW